MTPFIWNLQETQIYGCLGLEVGQEIDCKLARENFWDRGNDLKRLVIA